MTSVKETATKLVVGAMTLAQETAGLTGEEREHAVIRKLCVLDNATIFALIPDELEAQAACAILDELQEFFAKINLKAFVKKNYERVKHLLQRIVPGGKTGNEVD